MNNLFEVYSLFEVEPVKGIGNYVYDSMGNKYLDLYGGHAVISIGHSHPHYVAKISDQLNKLSFYSNSVQNSLQIELAQKLTQLAGCEHYNLFLCNSGAEANENALKLASFATGKSKIIAFQKGFHGRTSAAVNVTDSNKIKAPINTTFEVEFHTLNDLDAVKASLEKGDVCAIIIEGIQGIGGIHIADKDFLEQLACLSAKHGVILILDEVQSGYGRSGNFFGYQFAHFQPDIITMAKGMGNGFPIGGILIHPKHQAQRGILGSTFGGNHLACAAGIAVLEVIESENLIENARELGTYFMEQLRQMEGIVEVRGAGLMIGIELPEPIKSIRSKLLYQHKIFTGSSSDPNTIRILPPLNIDKSAVDFFLERFDKVLKTTMLTTT